MDKKEHRVDEEGQSMVTDAESTPEDADDTTEESTEMTEDVEQEPPMERPPIWQICWDIFTLPFRHWRYIFRQTFLAIAIFGPLVVMQTMKMMLLYDPDVLTDFQQWYITGAIASYIGTVIVSSDSEAISFTGFIFVFPGVIIWMFAAPWSVFHLGTIGREVFPQHSFAIYSAQVIFVLLLFVMMSSGSGNTTQQNSGGGGSQERNYSKTAAWYFFYK